MPRFVLPTLVIAVIVACALIDLEPFRPLPATIPSVAAASSPSVAPAVLHRADAPSLPATMASNPALGSSAPTSGSRRRPPEPSPAPRARPSTELVSISLADPADFVPQYRGHWCVGASLQMARSIITDNHDGSRRSQRRLWRAARARSPNSPYNGANPIGWAAMLNELGLGPYRLVSRPDFDAAVRTAARALAETGRPVGLVVWAGHHAWLMTGFEASGDPRVTDSRVTRVRVMDPLFPHRSRWGRAPAPDQLIGLDALARQFVRRHRPDYDLGVPSGWLLILPED
jgi:hypothetical protein